MKNKYRNWFLGLGIAALVVMLITFDVPWADVKANLYKAGFWLPVNVLLWAFIYGINAWSWYAIIRDRRDAGSRVPFRQVYKLTISGYVLNYVTPVGLLGGEPYRVLELAPYVGKARAASSVILYSMTHVFSHFCFWLTGVVLWLCCYPVDGWTGLLLGITGAVCLLVIYFFMKGYRNGLVVKTFRVLSHIPGLTRWAPRFLAQHAESLKRVDEQIAGLHGQRKSTFYLSVGLELLARIVGCLEIHFLMRLMVPEVTFLDSVLIMAFSSLFSNLMFFLPMQIGAREGSIALMTDQLHMQAGYGLFTGLLFRIRELIWIVIGLFLIKINPPKQEV